MPPDKSLSEERVRVSWPSADQLTLVCVCVRVCVDCQAVDMIVHRCNSVYLCACICTCVLGIARGIMCSMSEMQATAVFWPVLISLSR